MVPCIGDAVLITDIGKFVSTSDPGTSLVCVTSNINTNCCRVADGGRVGEWHFPNGTMVSPNSPTRPNSKNDITRSGYTHQVRLNRKNNASLPTGIYHCKVPHGVELVNASIILG